MGVRRELLDRLLHVTTIFLTATKTYQGSDTWCDLIPTPDSEERTDGKSVHRVLCSTDRTAKEDSNEFCLIKVRVPLRLSMV